MWRRNHCRHCRKAIPHRLDRNIQQPGAERGSQNRDQVTGQSRRETAQKQDHRQRTCPNAERRPVDRVESAEIGAPFCDELGRNLPHIQPQKIANLARCDDHRNPGGKACHNGHRNEAHEFAEPGIARDHEDDACKQCRKHQPRIAMRCDYPGDDDDERSRRPADLNARPAKRRNQDSSDDGRHQPLVGRSAAGNAECHCQRERHNRNRQPRQHIGAQIWKAIAFAQNRHQFRHEPVG